MDKQVYIHNEGKQVGPFAVAEIKEMLELKLISDKNPAWHEGLTEWKSLGEVLNSLNAAQPVVQALDTASRDGGTTSEVSLSIGQVKANAGVRFMAQLINILILVIPLFLILLLAAPSSNSALGNIGIFILILLYLMVIIAVQTSLLSSQGQDIGKKILKIRIVKKDTGENGGFVPNVMLRMVVNGLIGIIPFYSIVDLLFIFGSDRRCIHDYLAGTEVVNTFPEE